MYWQTRFDREDPDKKDMETIQKIRDTHKDYGCLRILRELKKRGIVMNKKKIQRLIRKFGIQVTSYGRKRRGYSSYKGTVGVVAANRFNRRFETAIPHQKITTDTTEFKYYERDSKGVLQQKKAYLDPYLDLFNREILCYRLGDQPNGQTASIGLAEAIAITADCPFRRTFHSDQGWAYQMPSYRKQLKDHNIFQSMSRKGNCWDNAPMESFFGTLKQEIYNGSAFLGFAELKKAIDEFIRYYNEDRMKGSLGWLSPVEYRLQLQAVS